MQRAPDAVGGTPELNSISRKSVDRIGARWSHRTGLAVALLLTLSSCAPQAAPVPTDSDLVGSWTHANGSRPSVLTLSADHTFAATGIPKGLLTQLVSPKGALVGPTVDVSGTWTIGDGNGKKRNPSGVPYVSLTLANVSYATGLYLYVSGTGGTTMLSDPYGDPDGGDKYSFKK
jgi:hypothetical protein